LKISIPYKKESVLVSVADERVLQIVEPNEVPVYDQDSLIKKALQSPCGGKSMDEFLDTDKEILIIVNDGSRPTPTKTVLKSLYPLIKDKKIRFIIATGVHRAPTQEEYEFIFGDLYEEWAHLIHSHDARNDEMVYLGISENGTEMYINKIGAEAENVIVIGSVEPHYFAGYTGGRKGFLPGIAAFKTIEQNHKHALSPHAHALALDGNPVHEDMIDALKTLDGKNIFTIMTVLDKHHNIYGCTAGDINEAFYAAINKADEVFVAPVKTKADIVVSVARYPMDIDLYQSQKSIDNGKLALKDGGILIMVSACRDGVGEEAFLKLLSSSKSPQEVLSRIENNYVLGYHKAGKMAEVNIWASVRAVSDLPDDLWESIFIKPQKSVQEALDQAFEEKGPEAKVLFLLDGSVTVPSIIAG